ncbi:MAG: hypothetical protein AAGH83_09790 [Pseudomonadota bacterium]
MIGKNVIAAAVLAVTAGAGFAQTGANLAPGHVRLAEFLNVDPVEFSTPQLVELELARDEDNLVRIRAILQEAGSDTPVWQIRK